MAESSAAAEAFRLAGISAREAGHRAVRGVYRFNMTWHSSIEVEVERGLFMLLCHGCYPTRSSPWPCEYYEKAERDLAEIEARWAREDEAKAAS